MLFSIVWLNLVWDTVTLNRSDQHHHDVHSCSTISTAGPWAGVSYNYFINEHRIANLQCKRTYVDSVAHYNDYMTNLELKNYFTSGTVKAQLRPDKTFHLSQLHGNFKSCCAQVLWPTYLGRTYCKLEVNWALTRLPHALVWLTCWTLVRTPLLEPGGWDEQAWQ